MKKHLFQKVVCLLLSVTTLFGALGITAAAGYKGSSTSTSLEEMKALVGADSYATYYEDYKNFVKPNLPSVSVDVMGVFGSGTVTENSQECLTSYAENRGAWADFGEDNWSNTVYLPASGSASWTFHIPDGAESLYYIRFEYFTCNTAESSISSIQRKLYLDGALPFSEASSITMTKQWTYDNITSVTTDAAAGDEEGTFVTYRTPMDGADAYYKDVTTVKDGKKTVQTYKLSQDINGNSMAPNASQLPTWNTYYCDDSTGYHDGYFAFYVLSGEHTLTLEAIRDPVIIKSIDLIPVDAEGMEQKSYEDVLKEYQAAGYKPATGSINAMPTIQAEFPDAVSDSSVAPENDTTSAVNFPSRPGAQLYNIIGENGYSTIGQWAAYKFTVNESGLYKLAMRYKQSELQGMYICRTIKLSGGEYGLADGTPTAPFKEAYNVKFDYHKDWQSSYLSDGNNEFWFYFEEGVEYTLYLECSLGSLRKLIQRVENALNIINSDYLSILQLTGSDPDASRDYSFEVAMPHVLRDFALQAIELTEVKRGLEELCGTNGSHIATLDTVAMLLDKMSADYGRNVAANMGNLKSYLGTLGTWINNSKQSKMIVDYIQLVPADAGAEQLPTANAGFFESLWFEIMSFFSSFTTDYNAMGLTSLPTEDTEVVAVWLAYGRDQSQIFRTLIDAKGGYTDSTGTAVALKLVTGGTLLPSILSGKGPDVYIGLGAADVINYAIRGAMLGVSGNDPVLKQRAESKGLGDAYNDVFKTTYYTYRNEDGTYTRSTEYDPTRELTFTSKSFEEYTEENFVPAAMRTLELLEVTYGIPTSMSFAMMFYRMDILAELDEEVPETWGELLALLPVFQANNMNIGLSYGEALDFMLYQMGGSMWKFEDDPEYAGAATGLDTDLALESFEFVCRLYSDYSLPIAYDAANRFRTGEIPLLIGGYTGLYNTLTVYATEIAGLWEFCSLPGSIDNNGLYNYNALAGVSATILLPGCEDNIQNAWEFVQWQTGANVQASYGNKMVALIGPSAKYETANINAIKNLSWTASERAAIEDQIAHLSSIPNYPGSYIYGRYVGFAFMDVQNNGSRPVDAISRYIDTINAEVTRKREEFKMKTYQDYLKEHGLDE